MSKNLAVVLVLTLITIIAWVTFQLFKLNTSNTIPQPTQEQMRQLNPDLDTKVLDKLRELQESPTSTPEQ